VLGHFFLEENQIRTIVCKKTAKTKIP